MDIFTEEHFLKFRIPHHSQEWFDFRTIGAQDYPGGLGASETSKLFRDKYNDPVNPHSPVAAEMYYHKIGSEVPNKILNENIYWGLKDEPQIIYSWQFWDGTPGSYVTNEARWVESGGNPETYEGGDPDLIFRKAIPAKYYLVNAKYPWLFCSLDSAISPGSVNMITGEILTKPAPLEVKTIGYHSAKGYETGVPDMYVLQLHHQMIVTEADYGEIVLKRDGQKLLVAYYQRDEALCQKIIEVTRDWWFGRVVPARRMWLEARTSENKGRTADFEKHMAQIMALEPEPDSTEAYHEWKMSKYQRVRNYMMGGPELYKQLRSMKVVDAYIKRLDKWKRRISNELEKEIVASGVNEIVFDDSSSLRYGKRGDHMRMYTNLKTEIDEDQVVASAKKLNWNL